MATADMQNVTTIATRGRVKLSGAGKTVKQKIGCFVTNSICYPYFEVFWGKVMGNGGK